MKRALQHRTAKPLNPAITTPGRDVRSCGPRLVRRSDANWLTVLLGTAAVGALSLAIGGPAAAAPTPCAINGAVATCSGDQSAGIASGTDFTAPPVTTLNVNNLTKAIAPAISTNGITFISSGDVTISSDTGGFGISATGFGGGGIYAGSGSGAVTVTSTGNITTTGIGGYGINGRSAGAVTITSTGNIATTGGAGSASLATALPPTQ